MPQVPVQDPTQRAHRIFRMAATIRAETLQLHGLD
jgi:hypothetical protein